MHNQNSRLALIHIAKKKLGLDEEAYRAILSGAGVFSAKEINTDEQFHTVMAAFLRLGFLPSGRKQGVKYRSTVTGTGGMISRRQEYYIRGLWDLASRAKDETSLHKIIKRIGKVDNIAFLPRHSAQAVILALRDICWKAGYNPDTREPVKTREASCFGP
ncbi:MAG: regulatory protein GemA [Treponema sp.]|jgi:hypothetical protein|nr:regulatory protein GemA [Treponema sp.]